MARVIRWDDVAGHGGRRALIPSEKGSVLALEAGRLAPGASVEISADVHDTLFFVHEGACALGEHELGGSGSLLVRAGEPGPSSS